MVSAYQMFAAFVDLVVGITEMVTWPVMVISWPFRFALKHLFLWWSYTIKTIVYSTLNIVLYPFDIIRAANREKETRNLLLIAQHQLLQATAIAKDLTAKYELAVEDRTHARDALETCVEERKMIKNKFHQAQAMLRIVDAERRRALEMLQARITDAPTKAETEAVTQGLQRRLAQDKEDTDCNPLPSPQSSPAVLQPETSAHPVFLDAQMANGQSEGNGHEADGLQIANHLKRRRRESNEGRRTSDISYFRESIGEGTRRGSLGLDSRRESLSEAVPRRESGMYDVVTPNEQAEEEEDGSSGLVSTVVSCGLVGWTLVVLGASTAAILGLFLIMVLPALIGPGKDSKWMQIAEYTRSLKWFVLGFVFCYYMETEEFSWFKQAVSQPGIDNLIAFSHASPGELGARLL